MTWRHVSPLAWIVAAVLAASPLFVAFLAVRLRGRWAFEWPCVVALAAYYLALAIGIACGLAFPAREGVIGGLQTIGCAGVGFGPVLSLALGAIVVTRPAPTDQIRCCVNCGYDMRGSPTGVCPECGQKG